MKTLPVTGLPMGEVPPAVLVCGDPQRSARTTAYLDEAELLSEQREYRAYRGRYLGMDVVVCSHGIGAPGAALAFEELIAAGAKRLVRIGTCGALQKEIDDGHLVIATAAVDATGYGRLVAPNGYPASADVSLTHTLIETAKAGGHPFHSGIVLTNDTFYDGVSTPFTPHYPTLAQANVLAVEMECAALFLVGSMRAVQTAAILAVDGYVGEEGETMESYEPHREVVAAAVEAEIEIALNTLRAVEGKG